LAQGRKGCIAVRRKERVFVGIVEKRRETISPLLSLKFKHCEVREIAEKMQRGGTLLHMEPLSV